MKAIVVALLMLLLVACQTNKPMGTGSLADLKEMHAAGHISDATHGIRSQALQDTALSLGAQAGLYWRAKQIDQVLEAHSKELDQVFNFNRLLLQEHVLPPVLQVSQKNLKLDGLDTIRLSDELYIIQRQARFVTTAPNWREYLWLSFQAPDEPPDNMLPKTAEERKVWRDYVALGWRQGVDQGDLILKDNLARLTRDFRGMILYRKLLAEKMVSAPFVARNALGITGGGDSLRINDQILQITALPALEIDARKWRAPVVPEVKAAGEAQNLLVGAESDE